MTDGRQQIILAEDDPDTRELICTVLEARGYAVAAAPWAAGAFDLALSLEPDLVILDLGLPDAEGSEAIELFRARPEFAEVPILLVTAEVRGPMMAQALSAGADSYLAKPFSPAALVEAVRRLIEPPGS